MRSLACLLREEGWGVTGSDVQAVEGDPTICVGHDAENIPPDVQLVIASDAVPPENCERQRASELGVPVISYAEMLGRLSSKRQTVAIAGTHGKSTTTAMLASILRAAGQSPAVVLGAEPIAVGRASRLIENEKTEAFVVEACEYNRNFLRLNPNLGVILGVEHDHFSCYDSFDDVKQAFSDFARRVPVDGILVVNGDCPTAVAVTNGFSCRRILVGFGSSCDWRLTEVTSHEGAVFGQNSSARQAAWRDSPWVFWSSQSGKRSDGGRYRDMPWGNWPGRIGRKDRPGIGRFSWIASSAGACGDYRGGPIL